jgi:hypothetical protein
MAALLGSPTDTVDSPAGGDPARPASLEGSVVPVEPAATSRDARCALDEDIAGLDLASISYLVVLNENWDLQKVDAIEFEYRCWLQCVRDFPDQVIVPSRDCDLYWHQHILFLALYLEQTRQLFGQPLLHWPFAGLLGEADAALQEARFLKSRRIVDDLVDRVRRTHSINLQTESESR